jgi:uncharacterized membrane protein
MNGERETARLEVLVGRLLGAGGLLSATALAVGLVLDTVRPTRSWATPTLNAGLVILMATPVARVVASVVLFVQERDWLFAGLTAIVLAVLVGSLLFGLAG